MTRLPVLSRIGGDLTAESLVPRNLVIALAVLLIAAAAPASAGDAKALAQGFKDEETCNEPYAKSLDASAFITCLNGLGAAYKGAAAAQQSYIVGVGFNAWSLANIVAATEDKELFPDIASRATTNFLHAAIDRSPHSKNCR